MPPASLTSAFIAPTPIIAGRHLNHLSSLHSVPRRLLHICTSPPTTKTTPTPTISAITVNPARTVVITGASGGIGQQTIHQLSTSLPSLQHALLCVRDTKRGDIVAATLRQRGLQTSVLPIHLSRADSITACSRDIRTALSGQPLDLLVCNAGVMAPPLSLVGGPNTTMLESQYFINHISHAALARALVPDLLASPAGRVVFVSSMAAALSRSRKTAPLWTEKRQGTVLDSTYRRWAAYSESKVAMSMFAKVFAQRVGGGVESVSLHPGVVQTELGRYILPSWMAKQAKEQANEEPGFGRKLLSRLLNFKLPSEGAALTVELCKAEQGTLDNGAMYIELGGRKVDPRIFPLLFNQEQCDTLYEDTVAYLDKFFKTK